MICLVAILLRCLFSLSAAGQGRQTGQAEQEIYKKNEVQIDTCVFTHMGRTRTLLKRKYRLTRVYLPTRAELRICEKKEVQTDTCVFPTPVEEGICDK